MLIVRFIKFQIDDQICLLINSWCELLLFSCCFRSVVTPGEIKISMGKSITLQQARQSGLHVSFGEFSFDRVIRYSYYFSVIPAMH